jgi:hypothetical protein
MKETHVKRTVMIALAVTAAILAALAMIPTHSAPSTVGPVPQWSWKDLGGD